MEVSCETFYDDVDNLYQYSKARLSSSDLEDALNHIWESVLNRFYQQFPINVSLNIIVKWIEPNDPINYGRGDLSHALKTANLFREAFPNARVYLINAFKKKGLLSYKSDKIETLELPSYSRETEYILGLLSPDTLLETICEWHPGVPCIMFDVASPKTSIWPFQNEHLEGRKEPRLLSCIHIDEYNGQRTLKRGFDHMRLNHMWVSCGIGLDQKCFPTIGVHLKPEMAYKTYDFPTMIEQLKDEKLVLELNLDYDSSFYFSYTNADDKFQWTRFIHLVLAYEDRLEKKHGVNLFLLTSIEKIQKILPAWKLALQLSWEKSSFRDVQLCYSHDGDRIYENFVLNGSSKRFVRIIEWTERVSYQDMINLMMGSGIVLQVTGDQSWAEAISLRNRVVFYQIVPWKLDFVGEMTAIANYLYGEESSLSMFFLYMNEKPSQSDFGRTWMSDHIGEMLDSGDLADNHEGYVDYLHSEYGINPWLFGLVKRLALHEIDHDLKKEENLVHFYRESRQKLHSQLRVLVGHLKKISRDIPSGIPEEKKCGTIMVEVSDTRKLFFDSAQEIFKQIIPTYKKSV